MCVFPEVRSLTPHSRHTTSVFNVFHNFLIAFGFTSLSPFLFGHFPIKYCSEQVCYTVSLVIPLLPFYYFLFRKADTRLKSKSTEF